MAATLPITKVVPYIKNYNNAAAFHLPQDITISIVNQHNPKTSKPHLSTNRLQDQQL
jgi:predicted 2-oxoglutarate/Fe(II)-dependent dioxygenase YbiX